MFTKWKRNVRSAVVIDHDDPHANLTFSLLNSMVASFPDIHIQWVGPHNDLIFHSFDIEHIQEAHKMKQCPIYQKICLVVDDSHPNFQDFVIRTNHNAFVVYRSKIHCTQQLFRMKRLHVVENEVASLQELLLYLDNNAQRISQPQEMNHRFISLHMENQKCWSDLINIFQLLMLSPTSMTRITCSSIFLTNLLVKHLIPTIKTKIEHHPIVVVVVPDQCPNEHRIWKQVKQKRGNGSGECPSIVGDLLLEPATKNIALLDKIFMLEHIDFPAHYMEQIYMEFPIHSVHEWSNRSFMYDHKNMTIRKRNNVHHNNKTRELLENRVPGIYILQETVAFHHCGLLGGLEIVQLSPMMKNLNPNLHCSYMPPRTIYSFEDLNLSFPKWVDDNMFNDILFELQLRDVISVWWQTIGEWSGFLHYLVAFNVLETCEQIIPPFVSLNRATMDSFWINEIKNRFRSESPVEENAHLFLLKNPNVRSIVNPDFASRSKKSIRSGRIGVRCFLVVMNWLKKQQPSSLPPLIPVHWCHHNQVYFPNHVKKWINAMMLPDDLSKKVLEFVWGLSPKPQYHMLLMEIGFVCMRSTRVKISFGCTSINKYQTHAQMLDPVKVKEFHKLVTRELMFQTKLS